jgi:ribosomal protein S26
VTEQQNQHDDSGELMYVKCAYCGKWMDVKPGNMTWVSHSLCEECLAKEMKKLEALKKPAENPPGNQ